MPYAQYGWQNGKRAKCTLNDLLAKLISSPCETGHAEEEGDGKEDVGNQTEQD